MSALEIVIVLWLIILTVIVYQSFKRVENWTLGVAGKIKWISEDLEKVERFVKDLEELEGVSELRHKKRILRAEK